MNLNGLISEYFGDSPSLPVIEMFDNESIYNVYKDIVNMLKKQSDIELSILQTLSYCFYEVLDNVMTHSMKPCGTVVLRYTPEAAKIQIMVVDDGIGICRSLSENEQYHNISEAEALKQCILDKVTDGKGMGFGLYSTICLIRQAGIMFHLHSGNHILIFDGANEIIKETSYWQGTVVYLEVWSDKEIDPNGVLENRTDAVSEFNDDFFDIDDIENLW